MFINLHEDKQKDCKDLGKAEERQIRGHNLEGPYFGLNLKHQNLSDENLVPSVAVHISGTFGVVWIVVLCHAQWLIHF